MKPAVWNMPEDRCKGKTKKGEQCKRPALFGGYCQRHYFKNLEESDKK